MTAQLDLALKEDAPLFEIREGHPAIEWLVGQLAAPGVEWLHASALLERIPRPVNENGRRWVRALADKSRGRVAGGQFGYKLVRKMTGEEHNHWRNVMKSQADKMIARIMEADKVFYSRAPVEGSTGILEPTFTPPEMEYAI